MEINKNEIKIFSSNDSSTSPVVLSGRSGPDEILHAHLIFTAESEKIDDNNSKIGLAVHYCDPVLMLNTKAKDYKMLFCYNITGKNEIIPYLMYSFAKWFWTKLDIMSGHINISKKRRDEVFAEINKETFFPFKYIKFGNIKHIIKDIASSKGTEIEVFGNLTNELLLAINYQKEELQNENW